MRLLNMSVDTMISKFNLKALYSNVEAYRAILAICLTRKGGLMDKSLKELFEEELEEELIAEKELEEETNSQLK
jgi:AAA+ superfamily predicted ATPase